jgi:REP element-mobilizing transposase RayT
MGVDYLRPMPRKARIDIPGLLQHVIVRGIEKRDIFLDDSDRAMFVARFSSLLVETGTDCFAWAMMTNHFHLLLRCGRVELSRFMRRLLTGYAVNFNHRHGRSGHLFQNRYKSVICEEDAYLLELIRYIHLNPLRAGVVSGLTGLDIYPWSGHSVLLGKEVLAGQVVEEVLLLFGKRLSTARKKYREFVADGVGHGRRPELVGGGLHRSRKASGQEEMVSFDDRVLGGSAFVESLRNDPNIRTMLSPKVSLLELREIVGVLFEVEPESMLCRARKNAVSEARAVFCYIAIRLIGIAGIEVGRYLGIGPSGISRSARRGALIFLGDPVMQKRLDKSLSH